MALRLAKDCKVMKQKRLNNQMSNKINNQMEQRQTSKSEDKIQKVNSSMAAFRQLIESLRNRNQHLAKPSSSDLNPEICSSSQSRLCASERAISNNQKIKVVSNIDKIVIPSAAPSVPNPPAMPNEDEGIKLKARGHVAGRDIMNKKPSVLPSSKFNDTVANNKESARNKNIELNSTFANEKDSQLPSIQHIKLLMNRSSSNKEERAEPKQELLVETFASSSRSQLNKTMTTMPLNKPKFQQNRLNFKAIASRNKIKDIDEQNVIRYCKQSKQLRHSCQANEIFDYFEGLMGRCNVAIASPFIKKFKNCVYFGNPVSQDQTYEGFLYFYQGKIYYGQFLKNQKNGKGVEILIQDQIIYKGIFKEGQKSGKFFVKKPDSNYIGYLEKGQYHGQGKLETRESIYQGQFENGEKQGFGQQFYPRTGVKMIGYFDRGIFSKRSKSSFSHSQIDKGFKFKFQNPIKSSQKKKFSSTSRLPSDQIEGTYGDFANQRNLGDNQLGLHTPPFSSTTQFPQRKTPFNKEKIRSFLPGMNNHRFIDPMPENCRDFDYSFDVSSRKDSEQFGQLGVLTGRNKLVHEKERKGTMLHFSQIQQENQHLDTSAIQQPLPIPCFFKT